MERIIKITKLESWARYEVFIFAGVLMTIGTALKLFFNYNFSSDWFWFIAGLGLIIEGAISLTKQIKFNKKYKIVERNEKTNSQSN